MNPPLFLIWQSDLKSVVKLDSNAKVHKALTLLSEGKSEYGLVYDQEGFLKGLVSIDDLKSVDADKQLAHTDVIQKKPIHSNELSRDSQGLLSLKKAFITSGKVFLIESRDKSILGVFDAETWNIVMSRIGPIHVQLDYRLAGQSSTEAIKCYCPLCSYCKYVSFFDHYNPPLCPTDKVALIPNR